MALRIYEYLGGTFQFEDGDVPEGAVLRVKAAPKPANKAKVAAQNKRKGAASARDNSGGKSASSVPKRS